MVNDAHASTTNALGLIGDTPLLEITRAYEGPGRLMAKAEFLQPGGSMKDRNGLFVVQSARRRGVLAPGQTVVEMTSGNMGAGLAIACAMLGHPFIATMSEGNSLARAKMMEAFGAQVVRVPQETGMPGMVTNEDIEAARKRAIEIANEQCGYYVDQWTNPDCATAHYQGTGPEIWRQTLGKLDAFVMIIGSAAAFMGAGRYLKEQSPSIQCIAVEPEGAEPIAGKPIVKPQHVLQGTGYAHVPERLDLDLVDGTIAVRDADAEAWRTRLGAQEALFVGYSAAANVCAAAKLIASGALGEAPTVVTLLCDTGLKYV